MPKFRVDESILNVFPDVVLGIIIARNINNSGERSEIITALRQEEAKTVERFAGFSINEHPQILPWREAYRKFGAKPKDYPSSVENLIKRVSKGYSLPHINLLVDIYNAISLRHIVPVGGEDLDKIEGDIELVFASDHEAAIRLLGEPEDRAPKPGEVIYKDNVGAICRRWNWKEADRTKFTEATKNAVIVIEGLPPVFRIQIENILKELSALIAEYCGGNISTVILDKNQHQHEF
ncbi:MAG TPA: phenylalanine--tRNA ligase beta subunit-related protein [Acidobacteriota bacterium]|nr:phenylalanine--tRNA ligase beta subunit-related protein [Acidobacteriota bacterium]